MNLLEKAKSYLENISEEDLIEEINAIPTDMRDAEINKLKGLLDRIHQGIVSTEPMSFMEIKDIIEEME